MKGAIAFVFVLLLAGGGFAVYLQFTGGQSGQPTHTASYSGTVPEGPVGVATMPYADSDNPNVEKAAGSDGGDDQLRAELTGYVECVQETRRDIRRSLARYDSWVDLEKGPTCRERRITYGLWALHERHVKTCREAAARGAGAPPSMPDVERLAGEYAELYATLQPLSARADEYYQSEDFRDDGCTAGREMHPELVRLFRQIIGVGDDLWPRLDALEVALTKRDLARLERSRGRNFEWHVRNHLLQCRLFTNALPRDFSAMKRRVKLPAEPFLAAFAPLHEATEGLRVHAEQHPEEVSAAFWGSAYVSSARGHHKQAKAVRRTVEAGNKLKRDALRELVQEYEDVRHSFGNVRFD